MKGKVLSCIHDLLKGRKMDRSGKQAALQARLEVWATLCWDLCCSSDAEMGYKRGQRARWKSLTTVQIINLVKLKADVNICVLLRDLQLNSR